MFVRFFKPSPEFICANATAIGTIAFQIIQNIRNEKRDPTYKMELQQNPDDESPSHSPEPTTPDLRPSL